MVPWVCNLSYFRYFISGPFPFPLSRPGGAAAGDLLGPVRAGASAAVRPSPSVGRWPARPRRAPCSRPSGGGGLPSRRPRHGSRAEGTPLRNAPCVLVVRREGSAAWADFSRGAFRAGPPRCRALNRATAVCSASVRHRDRPRPDARAVLFTLAATEQAVGSTRLRVRRRAARAARCFPGTPFLLGRGRGRGRSAGERPLAGAAEQRARVAGEGGYGGKPSDNGGAWQDGIEDSGAVGCFGRWLAHQVFLAVEGLSDLSLYTFVSRVFGLGNVRPASLSDRRSTS